jgi:hypothetical protein
MLHLEPKEGKGKPKQHREEKQSATPKNRSRWRHRAKSRPLMDGRKHWNYWGRYSLSGREREQWSAQKGRRSKLVELSREWEMEYGEVRERSRIQNNQRGGQPPKSANLRISKPTKHPSQTPKPPPTKPHGMKEGKWKVRIKSGREASNGQWELQNGRRKGIENLAAEWEAQYGRQETVVNGKMDSRSTGRTGEGRRVRIDIQTVFEFIPSDMEYTISNGQWLYTYTGPTRTPVTLRSLGVDLKDYMKGLKSSGKGQEELRKEIEADLNRPSEPLIFGRAKGVRVFAAIATEGKAKLASCLVDTGADRSVASFAFYDRLKSLGCAERKLPTAVPMRGAAGGRISATHGLFVKLRVLPRTEPTMVWILRANLSTSVDILLGNTFCDSENLDVNCRHGTLTWNNGGYPRVTLGSIGSKLRRRKALQRKPGLLRRRKKRTPPLPPSTRGSTKGDRKRPSPPGVPCTRPPPTPPRYLPRKGKKKAKVGLREPKIEDPQGAGARKRKTRRRRRSRKQPDNSESLARLNRLYVDCVQRGRSLELDWWNEAIEDHDDRIMDVAKRAVDDSVPVFSAEKGERGLRVGRRQMEYIPVFPLTTLPVGKWVFEPTVRPKYAGQLLWPTVVVEVKEGEKPGMGFGIPLCNVGERNAKIAPNKLVGRMRSYDTVMDFSNLGLDQTTELCAMETYEEFAAERSIVDTNDPVALAKHQQKVWETVKQNVGRDLTIDQEKSLREVVEQYAHIFSALKGQSPPVSEYGKLTPFTIDTGDKPPVSHRYVHRNPRKKKEIERHVQAMQRDGIIRDSTSPWASPVVLAMKKDGTTRFCVNYRPLNEISKKDRYPLPRIDEIMDRLGGQAWFSSLDMSAGYWVIPIAERDKEKTAFISHMGLKEFNVMPFGLTNAPAAYQRAMDAVLAGLIGVNSLVYIDDVLVFSETFEDHIRDLTSVLVRLAAAGMTINARKCCLCRKELLYLGHVVTTDGVKPDPRKIEDIQKALEPENLRQVRAFLGLVNYYRRYIPNCSLIQAPLTDMTKNAKKGEPPPKFVWTESCTEAWAKLKECLVAEPLMRHPDFNRRFVIDVDSCAVGVGATLSQNFEDGEHPVAYYSKKFTEDEAKWTSNELEAIGVIKALDHFRPYVWGADFDLRTDNMTVHLGWLKRQTKGKLARWAARLAEFDGYMNTIPRSGRKHGNADGPSRMRKTEEAPTSGDDCMGLGIPPQRREVAEQGLEDLVVRVEEALGNCPGRDEGGPDAEKESIQRLLEELMPLEHTHTKMRVAEMATEIRADKAAKEVRERTKENPFAPLTTQMARTRWRDALERVKQDLRDEECNAGNWVAQLAEEDKAQMRTRMSRRLDLAAG